MTAEKTLERILASRDLPTLPPVATKLLAITAQENCNAADIAKIVAQDVSLTAKMLKVVNSSFYNFPQKIGSINQAVAVLGINAVRSLALSFSFLQMKVCRDASREFNFQLFWEKSLANAVSARLIMSRLHEKNLEEIFSAGLLQNVGELMLALALPQEYGNLQKLVRENPRQKQSEIEKQLLGTDHAFIGAAVLRHWHFPEILATPIQYHLHPEDYNGTDSHIKKTAQVIHLADLLVSILYSDEPQQYHDLLTQKAKKMIGMDNKSLGTILDAVDSEMLQTSEYFDFKVNTPKSVTEILQEANIKLSLVNMSYEQMNRELVTAKVKLQNLTRELQEKNKILTQLANLDGLTQVYNHRYFQNSLDKELNRSRRNNNPFCLLLMDIDNFKRFNDTFGHQVGDFVLKGVCRVMQGQLREYDILARYGGEEFVIILPETGGEEGLKVAEKLRRAVADENFRDVQEQYQVTMSFGLTAYNPAEDKIGKDSLIEQADMALLEAKKKGKNQVVVFAQKRKWFAS